MRNSGFNCIRIDWNNKSLEDRDAAELDQFAQVVAACKKYGLKVIFDNHTNEAHGPNWQNVAQQMNGLWFDKGPGTDGTDGGGDVGTVTNAQFTKDWVTFAKMWAGNPTVIGFDIRNEPCAHTKTPALWGGGGPTDIHAMYERVGDAVLKVDPGALIICEAVINYNIGSYEGDFQHPKWLPIKLSNLSKLVYSVHEYPKEVGGYKGAEYGPEYIARMNRTWGWLIKKNIAPVWIGEMGTSADNPDGYAWAMLLLDYMNGKVSSGIQFKKGQQPVSGDWWCWGYLPGEHPDGCLTEDGKLNSAQTRFIDLLLFLPGDVK
jgi:aryl-phospho-beta-D-glucosidase BglC (GH1 family)